MSDWPPRTRHLSVIRPDALSPSMKRRSSIGTTIATSIKGFKTNQGIPCPSPSSDAVVITPDETADKNVSDEGDSAPLAKRFKTNHSTPCPGPRSDSVLVTPDETADDNMSDEEDSDADHTTCHRRSWGSNSQMSFRLDSTDEAESRGLVTARETLPILPFDKEHRPR
jgi:hypothetical protein